MAQRATLLMQRAARVFDVHRAIQWVAVDVDRAALQLNVRNADPDRAEPFCWEVEIDLPRWRYGEEHTAMRAL